MIIILMAVPQESNGLVEALAEKYNIKLFYTGIGLLAACSKATEVIINYKPKLILNLGTAGSKKFSVGDLVECTQFKNRATEVLPMLSQNYTVKPLTHLTLATCGSADFIDYTDKAEQYEVLDMEAYALAEVCQKLNVKFNSIKYVTDDSSGDVGKKWREHLKDGSVALSQCLEQLIQTKVLS